MVNWNDYNAIFKLRIETLWMKKQMEKVSKLDFNEANDFNKKNKSETKSWK